MKTLKGIMPFALLSFCAYLAGVIAELNWSPTEWPIETKALIFLPMAAVWVLIGLVLHLFNGIEID